MKDLNTVLSRFKRIKSIQKNES
uniref:Uncharacterized protein n=1 Tax=Rhizophora mucronata TaxID=61149 RepID=A0A2P2NTK8_RHIMU